jgi:hypothetical protein
MLLLGALLALLAIGLWMYALIDVLLTPGADCRGMTKRAWIAITGLLLVPGAMAWLLFGRPYTAPGRSRPGPAARSPWLSGNRRGLIGLDADAALRRHPAGRARPGSPANRPGSPADRSGSPADPARQDVAYEQQAVPPVRAVGPDDDPEFLRYLDRVITDIRESGNEA